MKKILKKVINLLINILVILSIFIIIVSIYYLVQTKIFKDKFVNVFGYTAFEVATGSMSGSIEAGDFIIVKLTKDVKLNDIVVYSEGENIITHRIVKIAGEMIITKGDANNVEDAPISVNDIIGKVIFIIRKAGIWKKVVLSPQVLISLTITIILIGIICIYDYVENEKEKNSEEKNDR